MAQTRIVQKVADVLIAGLTRAELLALGKVADVLIAGLTRAELLSLEESFEKAFFFPYDVGRIIHAHLVEEETTADLFGQKPPARSGSTL